VTCAAYSPSWVSKGSTEERSSSIQPRGRGRVGDQIGHPAERAQTFEVANLGAGRA
jgi:hypothetical protein